MVSSGLTEIVVPVAFGVKCIRTTPSTPHARTVHFSVHMRDCRPGCTLELVAPNASKAVSKYLKSLQPDGANLTMPIAAYCKASFCRRGSAAVVPGRVAART